MKKRYIVNPFTGRKIIVGGTTYRKLVLLLDRIEQHGGATETPSYTVREGSKDTGEPPAIPKSKYQLISSKLPPNPEEHSWYHHHAPFSQNFGDYVCLKRNTLNEMGTFLRDALFTNVKDRI